MSTIDITPPRYRRRDHDGPGFLGRAEMWLDDRGKGAWIAAMVVGFIVFWPVGLGLLAYMIWSKRMFSRHNHDGQGRWAACGNGRDMGRDRFHAARTAMRTSGNEAFDSYKTDTLRRLEDEQAAFEEFLARLRAAKDKAEFDQFMDDRARKNAGPAGDNGQDQAA